MELLAMVCKSREYQHKLQCLKKVCNVIVTDVTVHDVGVLIILPCYRDCAMRPTHNQSKNRLVGDAKCGKEGNCRHQQATLQLGAVGLVYWSRERVLALNDCPSLARYQAGQKTGCVIQVGLEPDLFLSSSSQIPIDGDLWLRPRATSSLPPDVRVQLW